MNTQSIQIVADERASQNSEQLEDIISIQSCRESNENIITTTDILNHDYNQMKLEEGRLHRLNQKKELKSSANNDNDLFITQVTLNLDIIANRPRSGSTWKYNSIKKNNNFQNSAAKNSLNNLAASTAQRPNTGRSHLSTESKRTQNQHEVSSLYLGTNRYSVASECSETLTVPQDAQSNLNPNSISQLSNRTRTQTRLSGREGSVMSETKSIKGFNSSIPQRAHFIRSSSKKARPTSSHHSKAITYMEVLRVKASTDSSSTCESSPTQTFTTANKRHNPRQSYTVAEFNKFKNRLLKNHSRNYYQYDSINMNSDYLKNNESTTSKTQDPSTCRESHPVFQLSNSIVSESIDISQKPKPERQLSQIKSIYETIQRANNSRLFSLEMRRSNYLNNVKNANNILTSSLMVQKMVRL